MSDQAVFCIEYFHAKAKCREALAKALLALAQQSKNESGCLQYDVLVDQEDDHKFILVLKYASIELMRAHENQSYIKQFEDHQMMELCSKVSWHDAKPLIK